MHNPYGPANASGSSATHSQSLIQVVGWLLIFTMAFILGPCLHDLIIRGVRDFLYDLRSGDWASNFFVRLPAYACIQFALIEWQFRFCDVRSTFPSWRFVIPLFAGVLNFQMYEWFRYGIERIIGLSVEWPLHRGIEALAFLTTTVVIVGLTVFASSRLPLKRRRTGGST